MKKNRNVVSLVSQRAEDGSRDPVIADHVVVGDGGPRRVRPGAHAACFSKRAGGLAMVGEGVSHLCWRGGGAAGRHAGRSSTSNSSRPAAGQSDNALPRDRPKANVAPSLTGCSLEAAGRGGFC